jgi:hypothetical protein
MTVKFIEGLSTRPWIRWGASVRQMFKTIGRKGVTFTPDIYAVASSVKCNGNNAYTIGLAKTHGLKEGDTVRLITEKNPELNVVAHVVMTRPSR